MSAVIVRCYKGEAPLYNTMEKISESIRQENPDIVGRPTYTSIKQKVEFYFTSLEGETNLNDLAEQLIHRFVNDDFIITADIPVYRDDNGTHYREGMIVVSLVE